MRIGEFWVMESHFRNLWVPVEVVEVKPVMVILRFKSGKCGTYRRTAQTFLGPFPSPKEAESKASWLSARFKNADKNAATIKVEKVRKQCL